MNKMKGKIKQLIVIVFPGKKTKKKTFLFKKERILFGED